MKDDPESVQAREYHRKVMRENAECEEELMMFETQVSIHPVIFTMLLLRLLKWMMSHMRQREEEARIRARETYHD
jgi:hypothetical protein